MLRARRISPRDSRRSGMPLNVDGWCEVVLQLTDGVRSAIGEEREHMRLALRKTHVGQKFLESQLPPGESPIYGPADSVGRAHRPFAKVVRFDCSSGSVK